MRSLLVHLAAVGVGIAQHVAGKLYHHHLHAQTDAESRDVVRAAVVGSYNLALDATLSESRTNQYAVLAFYLLSHILLGQIFRVDECDVHLAVVVRTGVREAFAYRLVSVLQVVFAHESDVHRLGSLAATFEERAPWTERRLLADRFAHLAQNGCVQSLVLHIDRHFVYTGQVFALYHTVEVDIAESCHLFHYPLIQVFLGA